MSSARVTQIPPEHPETTKRPEPNGKLAPATRNSQLFEKGSDDSAVCRGGIAEGETADTKRISEPVIRAESALDPIRDSRVLSGKRPQLLRLTSGGNQFGVFVRNA